MFYKGGNPVYVLRALEDGFYILKGECYVHGVIDGELADGEEARSRGIKRPMTMGRFCVCYEQLIQFYKSILHASACSNQQGRCKFEELELKYVSYFSFDFW